MILKSGTYRQTDTLFLELLSQIRINHYRYACGIQIEDNYVLTGGKTDKSWRKVLNYNRRGHVQPLADLNVGRVDHACGKFESVEGITVSFENPSITNVEHNRPQKKSLLIPIF